ncbi:MAG: tetratricopeptide repeat protein, partial [Pseudomonadota bacterium]
ADIERTRRNVHAWQGLKRLDAGRAAEPFVRTASDGAAMAFFNLAAAHAGERGLETPLIYARLALRLRPDFDEAYALIGQMYESADLQNLAVAAYAQARPGTPVYETAQIGLANALKDMDRTDEAIAMLSRLTEGRVQDYPYAAMRLGDLLSVDERHDDAIAVYDTAIAAFADMPGDAVWPYYFARGAAKLSADDWPGAEADLLTAYDAAPDNPYVLNFLGYSWIERSENLQKAFAMIEKAVALRPRDGAIVDSLGWGYYQLGDYAAAVAHLERAAALSSGDPTINDHLGDAYWRTGRYIEARFQWRRVLQLDPKPKLAAEAERKLEFGLDEAPALDDEAPR